MKPLDRRKLFTALQRSCRQSGLVMEEDPDAGGGSHGSLLFFDPASDSRLRIVIVYSRDISPGVQRAILQSVHRRAEMADALPGARALAQAVHALLKDCFEKGL